MQTGVRTSRRDSTAIGGSIAIHLVALALLASVPIVHATASFAFKEPPVTAQLVRIEYRPHARPAGHPAPVVQPVPTERPQTVHILRRSFVTKHAAVHTPVEAMHVLTIVAPATAQPTVATPARVAPNVAPVVVERQAPAVVATAAPATPAPPPTPDSGGIGSLAEDYPARPRADVVNDLASRGHTHAVVRVLVDEHGHAEQVTVLSGTLDDATRALIAAATYIPARCNGLDCEGVAMLRF